MTLRSFPGAGARGTARGWKKPTARAPERAQGRNAARRARSLPLPAPTGRAHGRRLVALGKPEAMAREGIEPGARTRAECPAAQRPANAPGGFPGGPAAPAAARMGPVIWLTWG